MSHAEDQLTSIAAALGRMEGRLDDLYHELKGNGQPGFITKTADRLNKLEREDHTRTWVARIAYGALSAALTLLAAFKDKIWHGAH